MVQSSRSGGTFASKVIVAIALALEVAILTGVAIFMRSVPPMFAYGVACGGFGALSLYYLAGA